MVLDIFYILKIDREVLYLWKCFGYLLFGFLGFLVLSKGI